ncbi:TATA-box binding protein [Aneurinibacillus soli]|uniref:Uncharacterized protein n=1 Tax=Aneurinibacillus soli TaxID=1500254 RepID=A0A0U5ARP4_9BACL|nr:YwmB family TATA-box binding protein [Aneurinibacillus soli]PYE61561.1 TATA-box binding protein [Aneurinibacillus soli]BAU26485.1 hypothetical protein CB4_00612 [Aneurinibacillus soli]
MKIYTVWKMILLVLLGVSALMVYPVVASMTETSDVDTAITHARNDLERLMQATRQTGAQVDTVSLRAKASFPALDTEEEQQKFLRKFGIPVWQQDVKDSIYSYTGEKKDGTIQLKIHVSFSSDKGVKKNNSDLSMEVTGEEKQVTEMEQELHTYLKSNGIRSELLQIMSCVRGFYSGKLKNDLQIEKTSRILAELNGKIVESLTEETIQSTSAYSPLLSTMIRTNHQPMNVQVATHYSQYQNRTTITVGTPIITAEYY